MTDAHAAEIVAVVAGVLGADPARLTPDTRAADVPGWDSARMVDIILELEERYAITLAPREVDRLRTLGDLIAAVRAKIA